MQALRVAARPAAGVRTRVLTQAVRSYAVPSTELRPSDDPQLAGYPELPYVSKQRRSAFGWDDPQMRRNFGETLHEQEEIVSMWGPDAPVVPPPRALRNFVTAFSTFGAFFAFLYYVHPEMPAIRRDYPYDGLAKELGGLEENKARAEAVLEED